MTYVKNASPTVTVVGPRYATTAADSSATGTFAWSNPSGALTSGDGLFAGVLVNAGSSSAFSHNLNLSAFGFAIPAAATVLGIGVDIAMSNSGTAVAEDTSVFLIKAGTVQTTNRATFAPIQPPLTTRTYGGPADLWGGTYAPSDINNSGFGVSFAVGTLPGASGQANVAVDFIRVTIYYQYGTGFAISQDAVAYGSQSVQLGTDGMYRKDPTGTVWAPVSTVIGDLPRVPPSGLEGGTIQTFLKFTRGNFASEPDAGIDDLSAQIFYRPSYLITP